MGSKTVYLALALVALILPLHSLAVEKHLIEASAGDGGSISPSGLILVDHEGSQTFTMTPKTGYRIKAVTVDGRSAGTGASYTFINVTGPHSIGVEFEEECFHTISASATEGGMISPSGAVIVNCEASQTFNIRPYDCYRLKDVVVDGVSQGAITSYTFDSVRDSHVIHALFIRLCPSVTLINARSRWISGILVVEAKAEDADGKIQKVEFSYSLDGKVWNTIGAVTKSPYSVSWDTELAIPASRDGVQIKAIATDDDGLSDEDDMSFGVDNEPPATQANYDGKWRNMDFTVNLKGQDGFGSGVKDTYYIVNKDGVKRSVSLAGHPLIESEGIDNELEFWSVDNVGNEEVHQTIRGIKLDKVSPMTEISLSGDSGENDWYISPVQVTLSAADVISGISSIKYRTDDGNWQEYSSSFNIGSDGRHKVEYYSLDNAGNREDAKAMDFRIDMTPPETIASLSGTQGGNGWYLGPVEVTLMSTDNHSGLNNTRYRVDSSDWQEYSSKFTISSDKEYKVEYYSVDMAGNAESQATISVKIDTQNPITTLSLLPEVPDGQNDWYISPVKATLSGSDSLSGLEVTRYRDGDSWRDYSIPFTVSKDGEHTIEYYSEDKAGNYEPTGVGLFNLDTTPPSTQFRVFGTKGKDNWYISTVSISLSAGDAGAGLDSTWYRMGEGEWRKYSGTVKIDEDGEYMVEYYSVDQAGNREETKSQSVRIDKTQPTTTVSFSGVAGENGWYVSIVDVMFSVGDSASGPQITRYRIDGGDWRRLYSDGVTVDTEGNHIIEYYSEDGAGNREDNDLSNLRIDLYPPEPILASSTSHLANGWSTNNSLSLSWTEPKDTSGIFGYSYVLDNKSLTIPDEESEGLACRKDYSGVSDGTWYFHVRARDNAGRWGKTAHYGYITIDTEAPELSELFHEPEVITEDTRGSLTIKASIVDELSGVFDRPQVTYRVNGNYTNWRYMDKVAGLWTYQIEEKWDELSGKIIYYKVKAFDNAGNSRESEERIIHIISNLEMRIKTQFPEWVSGKQKLEVEVNYEAVKILYMYSLDEAEWDLIAETDMAPYIIYWDTSHIALDGSVWIKAIAEEADVSGEEKSASFGVDNESPVTSNNYDEGWHNEDIVIGLTADDGSGSGVAITNYRINDSGIKSVSAHGPPRIITEGANSKLEYWSMDSAGNEEEHHVISGIKLDMTPPEIEDITDMKLTTSTTGSHRLRFRVSDTLSGIYSDSLQLSYVDIDGERHTVAMLHDSDDIWYYDIPEPRDRWRSHGGKEILYKIECADLAANATHIEGKGLTVEKFVVIEEVWHSATDILRFNDVLEVRMIGSGAKEASFDIKGLMTDGRMVETGAGVYEGSYTVRMGDNVADAQIVCHFGDAEKEADTNITIDAQTPSPPENVSAISFPGGLIKLSWKRSNSSDVWAYRIYVADELLDEVTSSSASWQDTMENGSYIFSISAVDRADNESSLSISSGVIADGIPPEPVENLQAESLPWAKIKLSWEVSASTDVRTYQISYNSGQASTTNTIWTSQTLQDGELYTFAVRAVDEIGNKSVAKIAEVTTVYNELPSVELKGTEGVQHSDVLINYRLNDREEERLGIICEYCMAGDNRWYSASTTGKTEGIDDYDGEITWNSRRDIPSTSGMDVNFRITSRDSQQNGKPSEVSFRLVNLLADYNDDGKIDSADLSVFQIAWKEQDISKEVGPANGSPPDMVLHPDGVIDFEDLGVFVLMWMWSNEKNVSATIKWVSQNKPMPGSFALLQNYPNPFNPDTWLPYQLAEDVDAIIWIHDVSGHLIRILNLGYKQAGFYTTRNKAAYWDGKNEVGEQVASGIYFYTIQAGEFTATKKIVVER